MTNKTPFELRSDALTQAQNYLTDLYHTQYNAVMDLANSTNTFLQNITPEGMKLPEFPTPADILGLADKFKEFIDGKSQTGKSA
jgi:hypothetical protein